MIQSEIHTTNGGTDDMKTWNRSTYCNADSPMCAEVNVDDDGNREVRNSTAPDVVVTFTAEEWLAFIEGVKAGEFD